MIGIVSYLPDDVNLSNIRIGIHKKQIEYLTSLFPNEKLHIVAQHYPDSYYLGNDNIIYHKYKDGLGAAGARNVILDMFYNSNDDILYLTDDDVLSYGYYDSDQFVYDFYYQSMYADSDVDMVIPLFPDFSPFKQVIYEKYDYTNYHILKKATINCCPNLILMRNVYKRYGKKLFYDNSKPLNDPDAVSDDLKFLTDFMINGWKAYTCMNWVKKSPSRNKTITFVNSSLEDNYALHQRIVDNLLNELSIKYGVLSFRDFNKKYNMAQNLLLLKRRNKYTITPNLIPKNKTKQNIKLF